MLSSVLRSPRAVQVNIEIMCTFIRLRRMLASHRDLARRLDELEKRYDAQFKIVFDAIRTLMTPPKPRPKRIGFRVEEARPAYRTRRLRRARLLQTPSPLEGEGRGEGGSGDRGLLGRSFGRRRGGES